MARKTNNPMLKTPDGIANLMLVDHVTPTDTGVAVVGGERMIIWLEISDKSLRHKASQTIADRVFEAKSGNNVEPINWADFGLDLDSTEAAN